jgi:arylsulfatase A-like enzyme
LSVPGAPRATGPRNECSRAASNVLVVLLDDVGFAASSAFGGVIDMPVCERLAKGGLKYTRFHTTAMCSPTRQALLTGRNHHSVGMGGITEIATSAPGYTSIRPSDKGTLPEILRLNGYSTAQFGKCHEIPAWQTSPLGPFDQRPTGGGGFEYFYGFIGGEANQYAPALYEGTKAIEPPKTPEHGYHLTEDLVDKRETTFASRRPTGSRADTGAAIAARSQQRSPAACATVPERTPASRP